MMVKNGILNKIGQGNRRTLFNPLQYSNAGEGIPVQRNIQIRCPDQRLHQPAVDSFHTISFNSGNIPTIMSHYRDTPETPQDGTNQITQHTQFVIGIHTVIDMDYRWAYGRIIP